MGNEVGGGMPVILVSRSSTLCSTTAIARNNWSVDMLDVDIAILTPLSSCRDQPGQAGPS